MTKKRTYLVILAGLLLAFSMTGVAYGERWVVVNGVRLDLAQIRVLENIACASIPNGSYWLDANTGIWGYAGDPRPQGRISDNCYAQQRRKSLSERGMLFGPQDWYR